ncbi:MAG: tetratricopeptide repeat-containing sensor histidine kinase [Prevotella sp.]|jgi:signal transduction histidine kinase|nr:tetratricopeptide repeat-containing sensor histidine kinase [Prevotella sp.]
MRLIISVFVISFLALNVFAEDNKSKVHAYYKQKQDSLLQILDKTTDDSIQHHLYVNLVKCYLHYKVKDALEYADKSLSVARKLNSSRMQATSLYLLGDVYKEYDNLTEAVKYYTWSLDYCKDDNYLRALNLINLSEIYRRNFKFEDAIKYAEDGLSLAEKCNNIEAKVFGNMVIGDIYGYEKKYDEAKVYLEKSLDILKTANAGYKYMDYYKSLLYESHVNIAIADFTYDTEDGIRRYKYVIDLWDKEKDKHPISALAMCGLAYTYLCITGNDSIMTVVEMNKKQLLIESDRLMSGAVEIIEGNKEVTTFNQMYAYEIYSLVKYYSGDYRAAFDYLKKYNDLNTSVFSHKKKEEFAIMENKREIENREYKLKISELTIKNKEEQMIFLLVGLALLSGIIVLVFCQYKSKQKTNKELRLLNEQLQIANKQKANFLAILNHDLRAPVAQLIEYLRFSKQLSEVSGPEKAEAYRQKILSAGDILLTEMKELLIWCKSQMQYFDPDIRNVDISELLDETTRFFSFEKDKINFSVNVENNLSINTDRNYLKTILRNLTSNAIKAIKKQYNPSIEYSAYKKNDHIIISVKDNGIGLSPDKVKELLSLYQVKDYNDGFGFQIVKDLASKIDCRIEILSSIEEGETTINLIFSDNKK